MADLLTIPEIIAVGESTIAYMGNDYALGSVFGQRLTKETSSVMVAYVTDALRWGYEANSGDDTLRGTANYLVWLCGIYGMQARSGSGGGSVIPINPSTSFEYLIPILGADFTDATNYDDERIVGKELQIFWNDIPRFLNADEFELTATGINILVPGFDATTNPTYSLKIYIVNP